MTDIAAHSSESNEWYTPREIVDAARTVFNTEIELDPASCDQANILVQAKRIFKIEDHGLIQSWAARTVYCNPPGGLRKEIGKPHERSSAAIWWQKMAGEFEHGRFAHGIFCCFSLNIFQTVQTLSYQPSHPLDFSVAIPSERVCYIAPNGEGSQPPHPSAFVCLTHSRTIDDRFHAVFGRLGYVTDSKQDF